MVPRGNDRSVELRRWLLVILLVTTVNGWHVVFKVSKGGDVSPASSVFTLWDGSATMNDNEAGFQNTNLTYMAPYQPTYKSNVINDWEQHSINYVKLGMYYRGKEAVSIVFDGNNTDKSNWFNSTKVLMASYGDLHSAAIYPFSLEGSYSLGRFLALKQDGVSCSGASGWFSIVDHDMNRFCGIQRNDTPFFIFSPNPTATTMDAMNISDSFAVFVDDCVVNSCQNGGTCTPYINRYTCECPNSFYGHSCHYSCPCKNGGVCHKIDEGDIINGQVFVNGSVINNEAIYLDDQTIVACECHQYFIGAICENTTLQCSSSPCYNLGVCVEEYTSFSCVCGEGYSGERCETIIPPVKQAGLNVGAKVAIGICIPLFILACMGVGYIIYMFKNPDAYGHEATVKQYTIAREFVRRSMRRISGRRGKPSDETKDTTAISPKEQEVDVGNVNLAFDDDGKASYSRQNSEYYNMSAEDGAVISGQSKRYPVGDQKRHEHASGRLPTGKAANNYKTDKLYYNEYRNADLKGVDNEPYGHPGHNYDEYNRNAYQFQENPVPKPRQTGRRGRQGNANESKYQTSNAQQNQTPLQDSQNQQRYPQNQNGAERYDATTNDNMHQTQSSRSPFPQQYGDRSDHERYNEYAQGGSQNKNQRLSTGFQPARDFSDRHETDARSQVENQKHNNYPDIISDSRHSPRYRQPNYDGRNRYADDDMHAPGDRHQHDNDRGRFSESVGRSPGYGQLYQERHTDSRQSLSYRAPERSTEDIQYRTQNYPELHAKDYRRSPSSDYQKSYDRYNQEAQSSAQRTDDRIVFTSSEPMDDVTV